MYDESEQIREETEQEKKLQLLQSVEKSDLNWVLSDIRGRRFLWRLLNDEESTGMLEQTWSPGRFDETAFKEGQRSIATKLFSEINEVSEEAYLLMMREAKKFKIKTRRKKNGSAANG